jgi:hypothetical protein
MRVTEITVSAGRTFNHPYEKYSNLKPQVTVKAALGEGEDWTEATKALQARAEMIVEDHKRIMLKQLEDLESLRTRQREAANLERTIREAQERLDRLRAAAGDVPALEGNVEGQDDKAEDAGDVRTPWPDRWR